MTFLASLSNLVFPLHFCFLLPELTFFYRHVWELAEAANKHSGTVYTSTQDAYPARILHIDGTLFWLQKVKRTRNFGAAPSYQKKKMFNRFHKSEIGQPYEKF